MTETLIHQVGKASLVFGLEWFALLDIRPDRVAWRIARRHRATHMVMSGHAVRAVGVISMRANKQAGRPGARRGRRAAHASPPACLHSAAVLFASHFPAGTVAALIEITPGLMWLIAVHEGVVIARTDSLYTDATAAVTALAELKLAYPHLRTPGQDGMPAVPGLDALSQHLGVQSQLIRLARWRSMDFSLPLAVAVILVLVLCASRLNASSRTPLSIDEAFAQPWGQPSQHEGGIAAKPVVVHGITGLQSLLHLFHALPVHPGGWTLADAQCEAQGLQWHCSARYRRDRPMATNQALLQHVPATWRISFASLDEARAEWHADAAGIPLQRARPMSPGHNDRHLLSALQGLHSIFTRLQIGVPAPLTLPAEPLLASMSATQTVSRYQRRPIRIEGPLRSASLLVDQAAFMGWSSAMLQIHEIDVPDAKRSRLFLTLEGELYESDNTTEHLQLDEHAGS